MITAATVAGPLSPYAFVITIMIGAVAGFLLAWVIFYNHYASKQFKAVEAAKQQARVDAWIEFQQAQQATPPGASADR